MSIWLLLSGDTVLIPEQITKQMLRVTMGDDGVFGIVTQKRLCFRHVTHQVTLVTIKRGVIPPKSSSPTSPVLELAENTGVFG
jgi:hypothetical protein